MRPSNPTRSAPRARDGAAPRGPRPLPSTRPSCARNALVARVIHHPGGARRRRRWPCRARSPTRRAPPCSCRVPRSTSTQWAPTPPPAVTIDTDAQLYLGPRGRSGGRASHGCPRRRRHLTPAHLGGTSEPRPQRHLRGTDPGDRPRGGRGGCLGDAPRASQGAGVPEHPTG